MSKTWNESFCKLDLFCVDLCKLSSWRRIWADVGAAEETETTPWNKENIIVSMFGVFDVKMQQT